MLTLADPDRAGPRRPTGSRRALVPMVFDVHPVEQLERHVRVALYFEDDMEMLKDVIVGPRLLFGSDFPHAEGLPEPTDIPGSSDDEIRPVVRDNVLDLIQAEHA